MAATVTNVDWWAAIGLAAAIEYLERIGLDRVRQHELRLTQRAHELLEGQIVTLADDPTQDTRDKYGRLLMYAWLPRGTMFNLLMTQEGYAHEYTYEIPYQHPR